ncbi:hypothetical protein IJI72_02090 [Candidatus Saccharibacteria bacterium]|nr:hypothetical protein [Candidatus Saccharibacteria bacterium]
MSNQEYLTEENYRKGQNTLKLIATVILIVSIIAGVLLITLGIIEKSTGSNNASAISFSDVEDRANADFETATSQMLEESRQQAEDMERKFDSSVEATRREFDADVAAINRNFGSTVMIMVGVFILIAGAMLSGFLFLIAHRREVTAFGVQQMMPIAKEATEKITPTVAKAAGTVAKTVTEGITRGTKNDKAKK